MWRGCLEELSLRTRGSEGHEDTCLPGVYQKGDPTCLAHQRYTGFTSKDILETFRVGSVPWEREVATQVWPAPVQQLLMLEDF